MKQIPTRKFGNSEFRLLLYEINMSRLGALVLTNLGKSYLQTSYEGNLLLWTACSVSSFLTVQYNISTTLIDTATATTKCYPSLLFLRISQNLNLTFKSLMIASVTFCISTTTISLFFIPKFKNYFKLWLIATFPSLFHRKLKILQAFQIATFHFQFSCKILDIWDKNCH